MHKRTAISAAAGLVMATGAASAGPTLFSNITEQGNIGFNGITPTEDPQPTIFDDAQIVGGGELSDITVNLSYAGGGFGAPGSIDMFAEVSIAIDDGDGQLTPGSEDLVWEGTSETRTVNQGDVELVTLDIDPGNTVPEDAQLWVGIGPRTTTTEFVNYGVQLFDDFTVGSSDDNFYVYDESSVNPSNAGSNGVGMEINAVPAPSGAAALAIGAAGLARRRRR